jgi:spermidine synthase
MKSCCALLSCLLVLAKSSAAPQGTIVFETISAHHHIRVVDSYQESPQGIRTLSFDGSMETRMSLNDPAQGHFEYTEHFHMPWLWNGLITNLLVIGLGGASTQRSWARYYPHVVVETVEIDPIVRDVAKRFFHFKETPQQIVHVSDGRVFLRRSEAKYDAILMDAYVQNRYGSSIPYQLATKEFFGLAADHLTTNGVLAYNVIGSMQASQADLVGSLYKTLKSVFPQVYAFPSRQSFNVVLLATKSRDPVAYTTLSSRATSLIYHKRILLPTFRDRLAAFRPDPPANYHSCKVLTDDFAPVDGLLRTGY